MAPRVNPSEQGSDTSGERDDPKDPLESLQRGVGAFLDVCLEFWGIEFAPVAPVFLGCQRAMLRGGQIALTGAPAQEETPGRLHFETAVLDKFNHPLAQVHYIGFQAGKPIGLCANINMKCYTRAIGPVD